MPRFECAFVENKKEQQTRLWRAGGAESVRGFSSLARKLARIALLLHGAFGSLAAAVAAAAAAASDRSVHIPHAEYVSLTQHPRIGLQKNKRTSTAPRTAVCM